jgi:hypothetical protein
MERSPRGLSSNGRLWCAATARAVRLLPSRLRISLELIVPSLCRQDILAERVHFRLLFPSLVRPGPTCTLLCRSQYNPHPFQRTHGVRELCPRSLRRRPAHRVEPLGYCWCVLSELSLWCPSSRPLAGQEEFDRLRSLSYAETHVVLLCYSVDNPTSLLNVESKVRMPVPLLRAVSDRCITHSG